MYSHARNHLPIWGVAGCATGSTRPLGTHLGAGFLASTLPDWNKETHAEARLPRNAVAWLKALSDTKIGRLDEAGSTRPFHFLALIHPSAWNRNSRKFPSSFMHSPGPIQQTVLCRMSRVHVPAYIRH